MNTASDKSMHIVVIGTSAGGIAALQEVVSQLHANMHAAYFIVMHIAEKGMGSLLEYRLQHYTRLPLVLANDGAPIKPGHIYIAPPDKHLLVSREGIKLGLGPRENRWKPSIDVLFRSAAANFNGRSIGVILTGYLNDGTSGMLAIRKSGGTCIVQDPNEAEYPNMPLSVINNMRVDYCTPLAQIGPVLEGVMRLTKAEVPVPDEVKAEASIAERAATGIEVVKEIGENSVYSCPDCGGVLFGVKDGDAFSHFRCHTGHSYSPHDLLHKQSEGFESTLWVALRSLEERKNLLRHMEQQNIKRGYHHSAAGYRERVEEIQVHIDRLKQSLFTTQKEDNNYQIRQGE